MELLIEAAFYVAAAIALTVGIVRLTDWLERQAMKRPPPEIREDMSIIDEPPYLGFVTTIQAKAVKCEQARIARDDPKDHKFHVLVILFVLLIACTVGGVVLSAKTRLGFPINC